MNKKVLDYINKCEGWKTAIKSLHWNADNLPQHQLCDDIASRIAEFQDQVSEVEQSINGKLQFNKLKGVDYHVTNLRSFVQDVLDDTNAFYKSLDDNDNYVGMKSDCESFLSDMQRQLYLVTFTMKEDLKRRIKNSINESKPKNLANVKSVDKFLGRKPKSIKSRIAKIDRIVKKYGIDSRAYDSSSSALSDYKTAISSLGGELSINGTSTEGTYGISILFEDGMRIDGYIKVFPNENGCETSIILWPREESKQVQEGNALNQENNGMTITESDLQQMVTEAVNRIINEIGDTPRGQYMLGKVGGRAAKRQMSHIGDKKFSDLQFDSADKAKEHNGGKLSKEYLKGHDDGFNYE